MAFPPAAALGTAIDTAEGVASGSPTQVAMGALGGPLKVARNVIAPLAVATGVTAPDEAEAGSLQRALQAIRAYHGSPHKFDRFDLSKIGTGEGAQAYGHGLYFAGDEDIAKFYRDRLTEGNHYYYNGKKLNADADINDLPMEVAAGHLWEHKGDKAAAKKQMIGSYPTEEAFRNGPYSKGQLEALEALDFSKLKAESPPGHMYEVGINARPEQLLNWDKPLRTQPEPMIELARDALKREGYLRPKDNGPRQLENAISQWRMERAGISDTPMQALLSGNRSLLGADQVQVAKTLNDAGIPGIKYLDAGSRNRIGDPTHNYVIFNDKLIDINRRYAQGGDVEPASVEDRALMLVSRQA
jgi:hypothetical protein